MQNDHLNDLKTIAIILHHKNELHYNIFASLPKDTIKEALIVLNKVAATP